MMRLQLMRAGAVFAGAVTLLTAGTVSGAGSDEGKKIYQEKCISCHAMEAGKKGGLKDRLVEKGPPLWFAGSKFNKEWLAGWLAKPEPILGVTWNTSAKGTTEHMALAAAEAAQVADYLMTATDTTMAAGKASAFPASRGEARKFLTDTRALFEKHQGCYACHRYLNKRNAEIGGFSAPSLITAKDRLQADWVYSFLVNPEKYYPVTRCPIPGAKAVNQFTDQNKADLAAYIVNMGEK